MIKLLSCTACVSSALLSVVGHSSTSFDVSGRYLRRGFLDDYFRKGYDRDAAYRADNAYLAKAKFFDEDAISAYRNAAYSEAASESNEVWDNAFRRGQEHQSRRKFNEKKLKEFANGYGWYSNGGEGKDSEFEKHVNSMSKSASRDYSAAEHASKVQRSFARRDASGEISGSRSRHHHSSDGSAEFDVSQRQSEEDSMSQYQREGLEEHAEKSEFAKGVARRGQGYRYGGRGEFGYSQGRAHVEKIGESESMDKAWNEAYDKGIWKSVSRADAAALEEGKEGRGKNGVLKIEKVSESHSEQGASRAYEKGRRDASRSFVARGSASGSRD